MLKPQQMFFFMIIRLQHFNDSLFILAPGRVFFSAKCAQFPLTFTG